MIEIIALLLLQPDQPEIRREEIIIISRKPVLVEDALLRWTKGKEGSQELYLPIELTIDNLQCVHLRARTGKVLGLSPTYCYDNSNALVKVHGVPPQARRPLQGGILPSKIVLPKIRDRNKSDAPFPTNHK